MLDWRAPMSRTFYQASARDPQGVAVRRRFGFAPGALTSFEDEHLDRGEELGTASRILTAEIERPRVGPMRDIVATIQPEQDELVRADLADSICVQGAPGTGKTAVGLHRAAYLLYLHRERLRRSGVLVVGPNRAFLRYIAAVLPALGEVEVEQTTVEDLIARVPVAGGRRPGGGRPQARRPDGRGAAPGAWTPRIAAPTEPIMVVRTARTAGGSASDAAAPDGRRDPPGGPAVRAPAGSGSGPGWSACCNARPRPAGPSRRATPGCAGWARPPGDRRSSTRSGRRSPRRGWCTPLLGDPDALAAAADGLLTDDEQALLRWAEAGRGPPKATRWTAADAVLSTRPPG